MPAEYCSYSDKFAKCKPWIAKNFPHLLEDGTKGMPHSFFVAFSTALSDQLSAGAPSSDGSALATESSSPDPVTAPEKPKLLPGGKVKKQEPLQIVITSEQRQRKKTVTHVANLGKFGIKLPDAAKLFSKKFACSASPAKDKDSILIQGDVKDDLVDFLLASFAVRPALLRSWLA